jgi:hypothetical protein
MSSGLPVIASSKGASHEQIEHNNDGFIYENENDLKDYVDYLAGSTQEQRKFGARARVSAVRRTWDSIFDRLIFDCQSFLKSNDIKALQTSEFPLATKKVAKSAVMFSLSILWLSILLVKSPEAFEHDWYTQKCHHHHYEHRIDINNEMQQKGFFIKNTYRNRNLMSDYKKRPIVQLDEGLLRTSQFLPE